MISLNKSNSIALIKGASLFTTGGGLAFDEQIQCLRKLKNFSIQLRSVSEFSKSDFLCTAAEVGPSDAPPLKKKKVIQRMITMLTRVSGKNISGLYPPEIGQESTLLEAAYYLKLPIADFDPTGFRAVPYVDINIFNLKKINTSFMPLIASSDQGEIIAVTGKTTYERTEEILRNLTMLSKTRLIFILAGIVSVNSLIENHISNSSLSKAIEFGGMKNFDVLIDILHPKLILKGKVMKRKEFNENGFSARIVFIKDNTRGVCKLIIMNEVMFVIDSQNKIISSVPERVLLINPQFLTGIQSGDLNPGINIIVLVVPPEKQWATKNALKLFGKERFSFLLERIS